MPSERQNVTTFPFDNVRAVSAAANPGVNSNRSKMLKSVSLAPGSFLNKKEQDDRDNTSIGPSQYQSIYPRDQLHNPHMHIHGLLASEYDGGNFAVTKMRPGNKPGHNSEEEEND